MAPRLEPEAGDLIEIFRGLFKHWAVYVGDGLVVHLTGTSKSSSGSSSGFSVSFGGDEMAVVKKEKLSVVAGGDKRRINNYLDKKYKPRPADVIVREACSMVGDEKLYKLFRGNCEHFATELRYGKAESRQVQDVATAAISGVLVGEAVVASAVGGACLAIGAPVVAVGMAATSVVAGVAGVVNLAKWLSK